MSTKATKKKAQAAVEASTSSVHGQVETPIPPHLRRSTASSTSGAADEAAAASHSCSRTDSLSVFLLCAMTVKCVNLINLINQITAFAETSTHMVEIEDQLVEREFATLVSGSFVGSFSYVALPSTSGGSKLDSFAVLFVPVGKSQKLRRHRNDMVCWETRVAPRFAHMMNAIFVPRATGTAMNDIDGRVDCFVIANTAKNVQESYLAHFSSAKARAEGVGSGHLSAVTIFCDTSPAGIGALPGCFPSSTLNANTNTFTAEFFGDENAAKLRDLSKQTDGERRVMTACLRQLFSRGVLLHANSHMRTTYVITNVE